MYIYLEFTFVLDWIFRASFRICCCCCCCCFVTVWFMIQRRHSIRLKPVLWVRYWRFLRHNTTRNPFGSRGLNHLPLLPFTCYGKRENTTKQNQKTKKWKRDFVWNSCFMQEQRDRERERGAVCFPIAWFSVHSFVWQKQTLPPFPASPMKLMEETVNPKILFFYPNTNLGWPDILK